MCGIAGLLLPERPAPDLVKRMCEAIRHRGPDGGGVSTHEDATLGMTRLAIVDIEHGHQPMANEDGSVVVVHNGEIYNAGELRGQLEQRGVRFRTRSDTEVILRLYEEDPDSVEEHLAGMWAFAIHDRRRRRALLSRDRFGIKPLFLADTGRTLAFASELFSLRPLWRDPGFASLFRLDPASAHAMLSWGYVPELATIYSGVTRLAPGSRLEINLATNARHVRRTWTLAPSEEAGRVRSLPEACELVEPLLSRAVREHLESDVPIAAFLSGGIDSSLVLSYALDAGTKPIKAFSIGFREERFDEAPYARAAASRLGVSTDVTYLDEETALAALPRALACYDEPFGDSSSLATYLLSEIVGRQYKVALGGDGGDEVFAGYKKHRIVRVRSGLARFPKLREGFASALGAVPVRTDRSRGWTELLRTIRRLARGLEGSDARAYVALTQVAALARTAPMVDSAISPTSLEDAAMARYLEASGTQLQRTLASDLGGPLPNDMLTKIDRASMANHLEARVPFLDHRVVEAGVGLPLQFSLGSSGKVVLRELHRRRFGQALAKRKKQGFGVPVEAWLRRSLTPVCDEIFSSDRLKRHGLLSARSFGGGAWRRWLTTDPQLLWHAFALAAWFENMHGEGLEALGVAAAKPSRPPQLPDQAATSA